MANESKGVTVQIKHGVSVLDRDHPTGISVKVSEGHLHVRDDEDFTIAIYSPGRWLNAEVK